MHHLKYLIPALILTGCSAVGSGGNQSAHQSQHGAYGAQGPAAYGQQTHRPQTCYATQCSPGSSYSVSNNQPSIYDHGQAYLQQPDAHAYGSQVQHYGGQHHGQHAQRGYGHPPQLRGPHGQMRRGYKYGSLGAVLYDVDSDYYGVQGRMGYQSANIWGAELEGSLGLTEETATASGVTATGKINHQVAAFGLARMPLSQKLSVHSRLGYHSTKATLELDDGTDFLETSDSDSGIAYGAGVEYAFSPRNSLRMDYTRYDLDGGGADSIALGIARKF